MIKESVFKKTIQHISEFGFTVISVFAGDDTPSFSYTIGLFETKGHPEIFMVGFDPELMQKLVHDVGVRVIEGKDKFKDGDFSFEIIQSYSVAFKQPAIVGSVKNPFYVATEYYGSEPFGMLQMFLPDKDGLFPWDDGCDTNFAKKQTSLFNKPVVH